MTIHIPHYEKSRVLVVGDIMLDRYWSGSTSRISPEAPVPVVHINEMQDRPGAAANVALNIKALGADTSLLSMSGDDAIADILVNELKAKNIHSHLQRVPHVPTISKLRVLSLHQQLIRLDFEKGFFHVDQQPLLEKYKECLNQVDAVVLSDYAKGVLRCAPELIQLARAKKIPVLIDPKGNDFSIYRGATILTPNRKEFEAIVGVCHSNEEISERGLTLIKELDLEALLVTRGEQGMTLLSLHEPPLHLPAKRREVFDVTGAGDTVIGVLAAGIAAKQTMAQATVFAN